MHVRFEKRGKLERHDWGMLIGETGKQLGYALLIKTRQYEDSFSINLADFRYTTRPGSDLSYYLFESASGRNKLVMELRKVREILTPFSQDQLEYFVIDWATLNGVPNLFEMPEPQHQFAFKDLPF